MLFRRFLLRFQDDYEIDVDEDDYGVYVLFNGSKSNIKIYYKLSGKNILIYADYNGPRRWIVWPRIKDIAVSTVREAIRLSENRHAGGRSAERDYSSILADLSVITRLLSKSMLVKSMEVGIQRGGFHGFIEELHETGVLRDYRVVYVSGAGVGTFRLLFVDGDLAGVYINISGKEIVGDPKALNMLEGLYRVKIYGSLSPLEKVMSRA